MKKVLISIISAFTLATPAFAEMAVLSQPLQAGSLHTGSLDMAAYRVDLADGAHEVTAVFRDRVGGEAQRVVMRLDNHDEVRFSVPGAMETIYSFARIGDTVEISADGAPIQLAAN